MAFNFNQLTTATSTEHNSNTNPIPALFGGNPDDVMFNWNGQLQECSIQAISGTYQNFGTVSFPVEDVSAVFSQDLVEHKRPNVPGARVESLGANPIIFKVKALFLYGLQRGDGESWSDLYPQTFSKVIQIINDQVAPTLIFTHPTMGQFNVKPKGASTVTSAHARNGQIVEFELVSANTDDSSLSNITTTSEFAAAQSAANIFDQQIATLTPAPPANIKSISLTQLLQTIRAAIDQTTLFINQLTSTVTNALFQIQMIKDSLDALGTAATSGLMNQLQRVESGIYSLFNNQALPGTTKSFGGQSPPKPLIPFTPTPPGVQNITSSPIPTTPTPSSVNPNLQSSGSTAAYNASFYNAKNPGTQTQVGIYFVAVDMTLAHIALNVHNTLDQLIMLNPSISQSPTVRNGTFFNYFVQNLTPPTNVALSGG